MYLRESNKDYLKNIKMLQSCGGGEVMSRSTPSSHRTISLQDMPNMEITSTSRHRPIIFVLCIVLFSAVHISVLMSPCLLCE